MCGNPFEDFHTRSAVGVLSILKWCDEGSRICRASRDVATQMSGRMQSTKYQRSLKIYWYVIAAVSSRGVGSGGE